MRVCRELHNLDRTIKEVINIKVNDLSLNRNTGKYQLSLIWDEVLFNIQVTHYINQPLGPLYPLSTPWCGQGAKGVHTLLNKDFTYRYGDRLASSINRYNMLVSGGTASVICNRFSGIHRSMWLCHLLCYLCSTLSATHHKTLMPSAICRILVSISVYTVLMKPCCLSW